MYIYDVLKMCNTLCPNEYTDTEKYTWCDEVSSMIMQEHLKKYDRVTIEPENDGAYLLPEGITFEMVDRIIDGTKEIDKTDFRSYGIEYYYGRHGRFVLPERNRVRGNIDVVYLMQHEPIRNIIINDTLTFKSNGFYLDNPRLVTGDSINVTIGETVLENVAVLSVDIGDDMRFFVTVPDGTFDELLSGASKKDIQCTIKRIVTEKTVCPAPYDRMYVDYVNAQICYYQRDFDTYNQHMNLFNQRLLSYQAWLQQRRVQDKDGRIINWF